MDSIDFQSDSVCKTDVETTSIESIMTFCQSLIKGKWNQNPVETAKNTLQSLWNAQQKQPLLSSGTLFEMMLFISGLSHIFIDLFFTPLYFLQTNQN